MNDSENVKGSCLCGKIKLSVKTFDRDVVACHCQQCRKQTGHFVAATRVENDNLLVEGAENVTWFRASGDAERGFCRHCGSLLFWRRDNSEKTSIMAGCFDGNTGLKIDRHIFVADKGDYYEINDSAKQFAEAD